MYIKQNEYFTVKEDTAEAIDITFSIREESISNIARLYDDEVPCSYNESDRYISEILFYHLIWMKFGALPERALYRIKQIAETVLSLSPSFFQLNPDEYEDFIQLTKELHSANISILTDDNIK